MRRSMSNAFTYSLIKPHMYNIESLCIAARYTALSTPQIESNIKNYTYDYSRASSYLSLQEVSPTESVEHPLDIKAKECHDYHVKLPFLKGLHQNSKFNKDLYTPLFTRGKGKTKEGLCRLCKEPNWYRIKISQYWYHLNITHGISSATG